MLIGGATALRWGPVLATRAYLGTVLVWPSGAVTPVQEAAPSYYVAAGGSDSASGAQGAPFATLAKAVATAVAGQTVALTRGLVLTPTATLNITKALTVRTTGTGATPLIQGSVAVTGWAAYTAVGGAPELQPNPQFSSWGSDSRNRGPVGWQTFSAGGSYVKEAGANQTDTSTYNGGSMILLDITGGASAEARFDATQASAAGVEHTLAFPARSPESMPVGVAIRNTETSEWLQADGTWGTALYEQVVALDPTITTKTLTVTSPTSVVVRPYFRRPTTVTGTGRIYIGRVVSFKSTVTSPTASNLYRAPITGTPGVVSRDGQWLVKTTDPDRVTTAAHVVTGGYLYLQSPTGTPTGVRAATTDKGLVLDVDDITVRGLAFEGTKRQAIQGWHDRNVIEDCTANLAGDQYQSGANGVFAFQTGTDCRMSRVRLTGLGTDAIYLLDTTRAILEDIDISLAFGFAADGIQSDFNNATTKAAANSIFRWGRIDQRGTPSAKGSIINSGDGTLIEHWELAGGHFGLEENASRTTVRHVIAHHVDGHGIASSGGNQETTSNTVVEDCLCHHNTIGLRAQPGTHTGKTFRRLTLADNPTGVAFLAAGITGSIAESIIWAPGRTGPAISIDNTAHANMPITRCIIGPEITGVPLVRWNGTDYATLAAWQTATGNGANCSSANPQFTTGVSHAYDLASGSPARTMSATGGRIGCPALIETGPRAAPTA